MTGALALIPAFWTLYAIAAPIRRRSATHARKDAIGPTFTTRVHRGNNPASQRIHELGGWRLSALIVAALWWGVWAIVAIIDPQGSDGRAFALVAMLAPFAAMIWAIPSRTIDLAEHGAEILHATKAGVVPQVEAWQSEHGFADYRAAEIWRMTQSGQDYHDMTEPECADAIDRLAWLSRIVWWLAEPRLPKLSRHTKETPR